MGIIFNNINRGSFPNNIIFSSLENNVVDIYKENMEKISHCCINTTSVDSKLTFLKKNMLKAFSFYLE